MQTVGLAWLEMGREARREEVGEEQELAEHRQHLRNRREEETEKLTEEALERRKTDRKGRNR